VVAADDDLSEIADRARVRPPLARPVLLSLLAVYIIWGSTYLGMRVAVETIPPYLMGGLRFTIAGTILLAVLRLRGAALPSRGQWLRAAPIGILYFCAGNGLVGFAEQSIASGVAAVVCATMPLWAALLGPLFGVRPSRGEWLGLVLGFGGVVVLSLGSDLRGSSAGAALLLASPLAWAIGSLLARRLDQPRGLMAAAAQMLTGGLGMLAISQLLGESAVAISGRSVGALAYLIGFGSLLGFPAYTYLLGNARPALAMSYAYVNPALAVVVGALLGGEVLGPTTALATGLIVAAVAVMVRARVPAPRRPA
jgi:drug/metabolite transporter (DMT)-like permease